MSTLEKIFAEKLLNVKAIKLQPEQPFTWASGWKSPFYCDNRKTLAFPALRSFVKLELSRIVAEKYPEADAIAGVATGAIAQGALVADALGLPFAYVRSKPKDIYICHYSLPFSYKISCSRKLKYSLSPITI